MPNDGNGTESERIYACDRCGQHRRERDLTTVDGSELLCRDCAGPQPHNDWARATVGAIISTRIAAAGGDLSALGAQLDEMLHLEETPTDTGNSLRFARLLGDELRFVPEEDAWLVWDGTRLRRDDRNAVMDMTRLVCDDVARHIGEVPEGERDAWRRWSAKSESKERREAMVRLARTLPALVVNAAMLDANPLLINFPNGTYDAAERRLRPHRFADYITRLWPAEYHPDAQDDVWDKVLAEVFDDDDPHGEAKLAHLLRFMGYTATGLTNEKKIFLPFGPPDTAKSTVTEAVLSAAGDVAEGGYATTWEAETVQANSRTNRAEKLHKARPARMIVVGELEKGSRMADGFVKRHSGGDTVDAKPMYHSSYSYRPQAKLWMPTNYVPRSADPAVQKRLDLIPFRHVPEKIDRSIIDHLQRDDGARRAVTASVVRGLEEYLDAVDAGAGQPLGETPWLDALLGDYARDSDALLDFKEACFDWRDDPAHSSHPDFVWAAYDVWSRDNVGKPLKRRVFERAMEEGGHVRRRIPAGSGPVFWYGLRIKPAAELPSDVVATLRLRFGDGCCP